MLLEKEFPAVRSTISRIPETIVSNPQSPPGDLPFIHHFWARTRSPAEVAMEMNQRLAYL